LVRVKLSKEELIFTAKVLDQRRLYCEYVLKKFITKDHISIKKKILFGINTKDHHHVIVAPRRELVYLSHSLIQYFIVSIKEGIYENEEKYVSILKQLAHVLNEDIEIVMKNLFSE
jgi:hypothetical protein